jgi:hypothetical protein
VADAERRALGPPDIPVVDLDSHPDHFDGAEPAEPFETIAPAADEIALILYTSGSTDGRRACPHPRRRFWSTAYRPCGDDLSRRHLR